MQIDDQGDYAMPPVPMTDEQKFFFDLRGWILLPAVLTDEREIEEMKQLLKISSTSLSSRHHGGSSRAAGSHAGGRSGAEEGRVPNVTSTRVPV